MDCKTVYTGSCKKTKLRRVIIMAKNNKNNAQNRANQNNAQNCTNQNSAQNKKQNSEQNCNQSYEQY